MKWFALAAVVGLLNLACLAQAPDSDKPAEAGPPAASSTTSSAQKSHQVDATPWLKKIDEKVGQLKTLHARVRYDTIQGLVGDMQTRFGDLYYDASSPRRFRIDFDGLVYPGEMRRDLHESLIFDGRYLADVKRDDKLFHRIELVGAGEDAKMFDLTDSEFPLPLDFDPQKIQRVYEVVQIDPAMDHPTLHRPLDNVVQLRLTPRPGRQNMQYRQIDIWFNRDTLLPELVHAIDAGDSGDESVTLLSEVKTDVTLDRDMFSTQPPNEPGWEIKLTPLPERREVKTETEIKVVK